MNIKNRGVLYTHLLTIITLTYIYHIIFTMMKDEEEDRVKNRGISFHTLLFICFMFLIIKQEFFSHPFNSPCFMYNLFIYILFFVCSLKE
jgi:hypothetical protein